MHLRVLTFIAFVNTSAVFVSCSINFAVACYNRVFKCPVALYDCSIRVFGCSIRVSRSFLIQLGVSFKEGLAPFFIFKGGFCTLVPPPLRGAETESTIKIDFSEL